MRTAALLCATTLLGAAACSGNSSNPSDSATNAAQPATSSAPSASAVSQGNDSLAPTRETQSLLTAGYESVTYYTGVTEYHFMTEDKMTMLQVRISNF